MYLFIMKARVESLMLKEVITNNICSSCDVDNNQWILKEIRNTPFLLNTNTSFNDDVIAQVLALCTGAQNNVELKQKTLVKHYLFAISITQSDRVLCVQSNMSIFNLLLAACTESHDNHNSGRCKEVFPNITPK